MRNLLTSAAFLLASAAAPALAALTIVPGTVPASVEIGTEFRPVLLATDQFGTPAAGATVRWSRNLLATKFQHEEVNRYCGTELNCSMTADANGLVHLPPLFSLFLGDQAITFVVVHPADPLTELGFVRIEIPVVPMARPPRMEVVDGPYSAVALGNVAPRVAVRVVDADGRPLEGVSLAFRSYGFGRGPEQAVAYFPDRAFEVPVRANANGIAEAPPLQASLGLGTGYVEAQLAVPNTHNYMTLRIPFTVTNAQGNSFISIQDLWWSGFEENGWGMSITQHDDRFFMVAFVYAPNGQPTWHVMSAGHWQSALRFSHFEGEWHSPRGAPYFNYSAADLQLGQPSMYSFGRFINENLGEIEFRRAPPYATKTIKRQDFSSATPSPITGLGDMWWGGPLQNGWGIAIHEQQGGLFSVWFTYDAQGFPTWFVMPSGNWTTANTYEGTIYRTQSSPWPAYDASRLEVIAVGSYRYTFAGSKQAATFEYSVGENKGSLSLVRQGF